jgi:hypothetical protein
MFAETRDSIAAALSTADGVTGYPVRPTTIKAGAAWPLLSTVDHGPGAAFSATWRVIVILPGDEVTAIDQTDALLPGLVEALSPVLFVDRAEPVGWEIREGQTLVATLPALAITGRSE